MRGHAGYELCGLAPFGFGEDAGFGFGDDAVLVGIAAADGVIEEGVAGVFFGMGVFKDDGDMDFAMAFAALAWREFAEGLVEEAAGRFVFEGDGEAFEVTVDGFLGGDATGAEGEGGGEGEGEEWEGELHGAGVGWGLRCGVGFRSVRGEGRLGGGITSRRSGGGG